MSDTIGRIFASAIAPIIFSIQSNIGMSLRQWLLGLGRVCNTDILWQKLSVRLVQLSYKV